MKKLKIVRIVAVLLLLVSLAGPAQAGDWPMFHRDLCHTGYAPDEKVPDDLELLWSFETGSWVDSSPAITDGKIFVASGDHKVYCLNENRGDLIWSYETGYVSSSSPAVADGKVFVGSNDGKIYCLDEGTGKAIWNKTVSVAPYSPVVSNGVVFIGSSDDKVYCLDENTGELIWSYKTGGDVFCSPAVASGKIFFGSNDGKIYWLFGILRGT